MNAQCQLCEVTKLIMNGLELPSNCPFIPSIMLVCAQTKLGLQPSLVHSQLYSYTGDNTAYVTDSCGLMYVQFIITLYL